MTGYNVKVGPGVTMVSDRVTACVVAQASGRGSAEGGEDGQAGQQVRLLVQLMDQAARQGAPAHQALLHINALLCGQKLEKQTINQHMQWTQWKRR